MRRGKNRTNAMGISKLTAQAESWKEKRVPIFKSNLKEKEASRMIRIDYRFVTLNFVREIS